MKANDNNNNNVKSLALMKKPNMNHVCVSFSYKYGVATHSGKRTRAQ